MAVAHDAITADLFEIASSNAFNHTCGASTTLLLVFVTFTEDTGSSTNVTSVTYNSVSMTREETEILNWAADNYTGVEVFSLADPDTGSAHEVSITMSETVIAGAGIAWSFTGSGKPMSRSSGLRASRSMSAGSGASRRWEC